jgi:hypothetical protein
MACPLFCGLVKDSMFYRYKPWKYISKFMQQKILKIAPDNLVKVFH